MLVDEFFLVVFGVHVRDERVERRDHIFGTVDQSFFSAGMIENCAHQTVVKAQRKTLHTYTHMYTYKEQDR